MRKRNTLGEGRSRNKRRNKRICRKKKKKEKGIWPRQRRICEADEV